MGLPGKLLPEYKSITLDKKHILRNYGYDTKLNKNNRHDALLKASKDLTYRSVISRLVALRTLTKTKNLKHSTGSILELQFFQSHFHSIYLTLIINHIQFSRLDRVTD